MTDDELRAFMPTYFPILNVSQIAKDLANLSDEELFVEMTEPLSAPTELCPTCTTSKSGK